MLFFFKIYIEVEKQKFNKVFVLILISNKDTKKCDQVSISILFSNIETQKCNKVSIFILFSNMYLNNYS